MNKSIAPHELHSADDILTPQLRVMHVISGDLWAGAEMQAYTLIKALAVNCNPIAVVLNEGELVNRLVKAGITVHVISEVDNNSITIIYKLIKIIKIYSPHIIHTHRIKENVVASIANIVSAFPRRRITCIRTVHGAPEHKGNLITLLRNKIDAWIGNYLQDSIIAVSSELAEQLTLQFGDKKVKTIRNGLEKNLITSYAPDLSILRTPGIHIGIVGRLEPVKRVDIFIEMAHILLNRANNSHYCFHVVGDGSLRSILEEQAHQLGIGHAVQFHGHRHDSQSVIAALDAVVMCSDHEGTPMTALETLALQKPLVAHAVGGLKEIMEDFQDLLVHTHCALAYAQTIEKALLRGLKTDLPNRYSQSTNTTLIMELYRSHIM
jgi:glycosyltransferase involved in cell wall biosynthesis